MTEQEIRDRTDAITIRVEQLTRRLNEIIELVEVMNNAPSSLMEGIKTEVSNILAEVDVLEAEVQSYKSIIGWQPEGEAS